MSFSASFASSGESDDFDGLAAFDNVEPAKERELLQPGIYRVRVLSGTYDKTRSGKDAYKMSFEVIEGPHTGQRVYRFWTFTSKSMIYVKRDLLVFGLKNREDLLQSFPPEGEIIELTIVVSVQKSEDYGASNDIKSFRNVVRKTIEVLPPNGAKSPFEEFNLDEPQNEGRE